jgi:hypothetical protein
VASRARANLVAIRVWANLVASRVSMAWANL